MSMINITYNGLLTFLFNTLRPRQYGRHFPDDIFKCIFVNENVLIWIQISLKFVRKGPINNMPSLVQIMAWRRPGDKPLSEPMMIILLTHICVTRPQWVKRNNPCYGFMQLCSIFVAPICHLCTRFRRCRRNLNPKLTLLAEFFFF